MCIPLPSLHRRISKVKTILEETEQAMIKERWNGIASRIHKSGPFFSTKWKKKIMI